MVLDSFDFRDQRGWYVNELINLASINLSTVSNLERDLLRYFKEDKGTENTEH